MKASLVKIKEWGAEPYIPTLFPEHERTDFLFHLILKNSCRHWKVFSLKVEIGDFKVSYSQSACKTNKSGKRVKLKDHPLTSTHPPNHPPNYPAPPMLPLPPTTPPLPTLPTHTTLTAKDIQRCMEQIDNHKSLLTAKNVFFLNRVSLKPSPTLVGLTLKIIKGKGGLTNTSLGDL